MRAAVYCRYSSDNQNFASIDAQLRAINEHCKANDIDIVKTYIDEALTATNDDRVEFLNMIADSERKIFDMVIVHKLDRFARNRYDAAFYRKKLNDNGVKIVSVLEPLDDSPESMLFLGIIESIAEYYSKNLAREVMKGLKENALKAKHNGGIAPLGYDVNDDLTYRINEREAQAVKMIYKLYLDGFGYALIASELNSQAYKTKLGKSFAKNSVRDVLLNEKYTGVYIYNKRLSKKDNHKYKSDDKIIRIESAMPQIIDKEIFDKAQAKLKSNVRGPRQNCKRFYILTGLLKCGVCAGSYSGWGYIHNKKDAGRSYEIYACATRKSSKTCDNPTIRKDFIENFVIEYMKENIFSESAIDKLTALIASTLATVKSNVKNDISVLTKDKNSTQAKIKRLLDLYLENEIDKKVLKYKTDELQAELEKIEKRIIEVERKNYDLVNEATIRNFLIYQRDNLNNADDITKMNVARTFIHEIIVYKDRFDITFKIDDLSVSGKVGGDKPILTIPLTICKTKLSKAMH